MRMNRILSLVVTAAMCLSMTACGGASSVQKSSETASTNSGSDKLSVMIWDSNQQPGVQTLLDEFTKKTGVKTELTVVAWDEYWTALEAAAQGGSMPDVFWMHSNEAQRYMSNGMLLDLSDKISKSSDIDLSKYPKDIVDLYTYEGKNYAIPKDIDTIALWYNKKMFDAAGIAYPDDTWTWDTVRQAAKKLTKSDGSQYGIAMAPNEEQCNFYNLVYAMGGYVLNPDKTKSGFDQAGTIRAEQYMKDLITDGSMPSLQMISENKADVLFTSGKVAMLPYGSWALAEFRDNEYSRKNCDVAVLPKDAQTGTRASIYNGLGWTAAANGKHTDDAWKLLEFLGSKEGQTRQAELGVTMSAYQGTSDAWAKSVPGFNLAAHLKMMDNMIILPHSRSTLKWQQKLEDAQKTLWTPGTTAQQICSDLNSSVNEILSQEG